MVVDHEGCSNLDKEIATAFGVLMEKLSCSGAWLELAKVRSSWVDFATRFRGNARAEIATVENDARAALRQENYPTF